MLITKLVVNATPLVGLMVIVPPDGGRLTFTTIVVCEGITYTGF